MKHLKLASIFAACTWCISGAMAENLDIPDALWATFSQNDKFSISAAFDVNLLPAMSFGTIIDAQTLDSSTHGTNGGAVLGSAFASAAYVDSSFKGNYNYSAKKDIGAAILGGMLGSAIDRAPVVSFRTKYTVRFHDGSIGYVEDTTETPFRHSLGVCVRLSPLRQANQGLCSMTKDSVLATISGKERQTAQVELNLPNIIPSVNTDEDTKVLCIIGNNPPTYLSKQLCDATGGKMK